MKFSEYLRFVIFCGNCWRWFLMCHWRLWKSTAEGRQFNIGKLHHPNATFKSIMEAIRLRGLNQNKEDHLADLSRLKEKAISSNVPFEITNHILAMSWNLEELRYIALPKMWHERCCTDLGCITSPTATSIKEWCKLNYDSNDYLQKFITIGQKLSSKNNLALNKTKKANWKFVRASWTICAL